MRAVLHALHRRYYLFAMYSGWRACANRLLSRLCRRKVRLPELHGGEIATDGFGAFLASVHSRQRPATGSRAHRFGMISLRQRRPKMPRWHYRFILLTTHFGCGHVELAFYQDGKRITVYGVRNTARSNAERIGWGSAAASLALTDSTDESHIVFPVMRLLREHGYGVRLAPANECVSLCLSPTLLKPAAEPATASSLRRKYERLRRATRSHVA